MDIREALNNVLVDLFHHIIHIEEKALIVEPFTDMSVNDMHVVEAVGDGEKKTMTTVARELGVTVGTLTIAVNNLVKKGYIERVRGEVDRRIVYIFLTDRGLAAYRHHVKFHQDMINSITGNLTEEEAQVLAKSLSGLDVFFKALR